MEFPDCGQILGAGMSEAIFGIIGVIVGGAIVIAKDVVAYLLEQRRKARYLAVRVVCSLDQYVEECIEVVKDDGTRAGAAERDKSGQKFYVPQVSLPEPPAYPEDADWKSIDSGLMYRLLALPNNARSTNRLIWSVDEDTSDMDPDKDELFEARWEGYAALGLDALELAKELRGHRTFNIPARNYYSQWNPDWDPEQYLTDAKKAVAERQERRASSLPKMHGTFQEKSGDKE